MKKILIIENDMDLLQVMKDALSERGLSVIGLIDESRVIEIMKNNSMDLIILDLVGASERDLVFLKDIRAEFNRIPMILIQGVGATNDMGSEKHYIDEASNTIFLTMPFKKNKLIDLVHQLTRASQNTRQH